MSERDLEAPGVLVTVIDLGEGAWLHHEPTWLDPAAFGALRASLAFSQVPIRIMGRELLQPRLTAWYGDAGATYTYSGRTFRPLPWTAELRTILGRLVGRYNSCLCNLYRDGRDSIGLHADDEPELGPLPQIASVSLGSARRFVLRHGREKGRKVELELGGGALLVMGGTTQLHWKHEVPKTTAGVGERLNLTFRQIEVGHVG